MIREYIYADTNFGIMVFATTAELQKFIHRETKPTIRSMKTYWAENEAEVYAAARADLSCNELSGVGGEKTIAKRDEKYFRQLKRQRFGRWVDTPPMETFQLSKDEMAEYMKTHKLPANPKKKPMGSVIIKDTSKIKTKRSGSAINLTGMSAEEKQKVLKELGLIKG